jgi:HK97 family phage major capsid protein
MSLDAATQAAIDRQLPIIQRRQALRNSIRAMCDQFKRNGNKWNTDAERDAFNAACEEYDVTEAAHRRAARESCDGVTAEPTTLDRALSAWTRNQSGFPISAEESDACLSYGIAPHSGTFSCRFRSSGPTVGAPIFETRASNVKGTDNLGGYAVPQGFFPSLERAMLNFAGILNVAEVIRTLDGRTMPWPTSNDTGNTGAMIGESTAVAEQTVPFSVVNFKAWKAQSKLVRVSTELLRDNGVDLAGQLGAILGERLGRILNTKCTVGAGTTEPTGIVTAASLGNTTASSTAITMDEIIELVHSVDVSYRSAAYNCGFMLSDTVAKYLRKLKDSDGRYLWQDSPIFGQPATLLGWPVTINNAMSASIATTEKTVLFGALAKFRIRIVNDVRIRRLVERYADYDEEGFLGFIEFDSNLVDGGGGAIKYLAQA